MNAHLRLTRFLIGLVLLLILVPAGFAIVYPTITNFGAGPDDLSQTLPGDELLTKPIIQWSHAVTINASPEQVWPWLIQMGDTRGGFYSFMFIERLFPESSELYNNADRIHPEWQNPPTGQGMISTMLKIVDYKPGDYMFASIDPDEGIGWTWAWKILPIPDGRTRMLVHMRIQVPDEMNKPVYAVLMNLAAFVMERNMLDGIQLRAEGRSEPNWLEPVEIFLWLATLVAGAAGAVRFITRPGWQVPLAIALGSLAALFVLTYVQPPIFVRLVILLVLLAGLGWDIARARQPKTQSAVVVPTL